MKLQNVITILALTAVLLAIMTIPAMAATYEVNGDLHD
jgi:cell division protein FtsL